MLFDLRPKSPALKKFVMPRPTALGLALGLLVGAPTMTVAAALLTNAVIGRQADGSVVIESNQVITPAGRQLEFRSRPYAVALSPDGKTAAFLGGVTSGNGTNGIVLVDLATGTIRQTLNFGSSNNASFNGIVYSPDGTQVFASISEGRLLIASVAVDGTLTQSALVTLPVTSGRGNPYPGGLGISADGTKLYIALNRYNSLGIFDTTSRTLTGQIPVGNAPFAVLIAGNKAYVSNQGGRVAVPGDFTNLSTGTNIVADPDTGGSVTGTVSVVNLDSNTLASTIAVGLHPTGLTRSGQYLFVANTHSDSVSVVDTATDSVVKTIDIKPFEGAPFGSSPNALAFIGTDRLVVGLSANNALAVYDWQGPAQPTTLQGHLPTAWFPGALAVDSQNQQLAVGNIKGVGSLGPVVNSNPNSHQSYATVGSVSLIPFPSAEELVAGSAKVAINNGWDQLASAGPGDPNAAPRAIPRRLGEPSLIKHVFYIIKENRTYDQVLGDDARGNGDPSLLLFGEQVTPNQHALARQFALIDNFYNIGALSADGHQWAVQAYNPDYVERHFSNTSVRSYPFNGGDSLAYTPSGFLWQNALDHGVSVRNYGEYLNQFTAPGGQAFGQWSDWYRDALILRGEQTGNLHVPVGAFQATGDVPALNRISNPAFPNYTNNIPDIYRTEIWLQDFRAYVRKGGLPALSIIELNTDHTGGPPTPRAQVADNDLAVGRVIDAISHSPYWASSVIFIEEDDTQAGTDHVDGHRGPVQVISPYVRHGIVDSTYYSQLSFVRTMEQILGLPPMNQLDLAAQPMFDLFTDTPDLTPFNALPNQIPLDELRTASSANPVQQAWIDVHKKMFARRDARPDEQNEQLLNRAIWYSVKGYKTPYPGDKRVLLPREVLALTGGKDSD